jgi:PAS domain S-box-containing protein
VSQEQDEEALLRSVALQNANSIFIARQREETLRAHLAAVVESSDDAVISKTLEGIITTWNKGAERMFGHSAMEAIGKPVTILIPADRLHEEAHILKMVKNGLRIEHYETVRVRKDGTFLDISLSVSPIRDSSGQLIGASKIARDITLRKRAEKSILENTERLHLALAAAKLGDWDWDPADDLIYLSSRAAAIFGVPSHPPVTRAQMREFIHPDYREKARLANIQAAADHRDYEIEYRVIRPDGVQIWAAAKGRGMYDADGKLVRMFGVLQDITQRKQVELEREQLLEAERAARADAERMSIMKDEFLATLSHELRTPLNAIMGWSQLLRSRAHDDEELTEGLSVIERNTRVQTQLIEDLLDMSRIISGKIRLDLQRVDLQEVVKAALASVRHSAEAKEIRLEIVMDPHAGPVLGDPGRLQQCFWNLLSNAIKFTPKRGKIRISLQRINSHLEVCVADDGEGIKPDFLPHVFERFRQADASTTRRHGGLGLGLSIVRQLVELHGGTVRAESAGIGKGATFCINLPLMVVREQPADERRDHPRGSPLDPSALDPPSLRGITVLAVDDEPDARNLLKRVLEDCGAKVLLAASANEALAVLIRERPDMIVSDIGMPEQDGYEFIRKVRALTPEQGGRTPAAALTAFARSDDRTRALRAGFQSHIAKPVDSTELAAVVASLAAKS